MNMKQVKLDLSIFEDIALLYEYPKEELVPVVSLLIKKFSSQTNTLFQQMNEKLQLFFDYCTSNQLSTLEENYIATFEMNTKYILYIGHLIFGETYERSEFISQLNELYDQYGFKLESNELADHVGVIFRFLARNNLSFKTRESLVKNLKQGLDEKEQSEVDAEEQFLLELERRNKYPILYLLLSDLVEVLEKWEYD